MPTVQADKLQGQCAELAAASGVPRDEARILADSLVDSNLAGHDSHGVMALPRYLRQFAEGKLRKACKLEIERQTPNIARIHAHDSHGAVAGRKVTEIAIEKAMTGGVAAVAVHHIGHVGRLGQYPEIAARRGCVAIMTINNHGSSVWVHPFGGTDRRLSPNPLGIGAPTGSGPPIVLDISGSTVAAGKVLVQQSKGEPIPLGWMLDGHGKPTTDPAALFGPPPGALVPLGGDQAGHKGYALAFVMDILGGALTGAGCSAEDTWSHRNGMLLVVLRIENFVELADFTGEVDRLIEWVKASPRSDPDREILYPGQFEADNRRRRLADGILLPDSVLAELREWAENLGVAWQLEIDA